MPSNLLSVPHYRQSHPGACLPACARMVLAYWQHDSSEADLAHLLGTREFGTPAPNIHRLQKLGFSITYESVTLSLIKERLTNRIPPVAFVKTGDLPYWNENTAHALVVVGFDGVAIYVNDPAMIQAPQTVPVDYFLLAWSEFDHRYAVIEPSVTP
jgi:ABC-type bacteriocin/lantibiotic exporter with double-glycine peptidase domain